MSWVAINQEGREWVGEKLEGTQGARIVDGQGDRSPSSPKTPSEALWECGPAA